MRVVHIAVLHSNCAFWCCM